MIKKIHNFLRDHKELAVILLLAFFARGLFLLAVYKESGPTGFAPSVNEDSLEYVSIAKNLAEHGVFSRASEAPFAPERLRTPGYPFFLSLFYRISPRLEFLAFAQNLFFLFAIILLYRIILAINGNKKLALIASGFLAFEPATLYWNSQLTTESLFALIVLASFFCLFLFLKRLKARFIFYSGFFLGSALLIRPITEYLSIIFLVGIPAMGFLGKLPLKKIVSGAAIFLLGYALVVAPWMFRNKALFGAASVSTMNVGFGKYVRAIHGELGIYVDYTNFGGQARSEVERLAIVRADALKTIIRHPLIFAKIHLSALPPFFLGDGYVTALSAVFPALKGAQVVTNWSGNPLELLTFLRGHRGAEGLIFWSGKALWLALTAAAIFGLWSLYRQGGMKRYSAILIFAVIYYFALASGVGSYSRFRFPVNPFIFYFAAAGIVVLLERLSAAKMSKPAGE